MAGRRVVLLTGPSGAGKNFVTENCDDHGVANVDVDNLFNLLKKHLYPDTDLPDHDAIYRDMNKQDWALKFTKLWGSVWDGSGNNLIVHGVQSSWLQFRNALVTSLELVDDNVMMCLIMPSVEDLLAQRQGSKKKYHQKVANQSRCIQDLQSFRKRVNEAPFSPMKECVSKEEALRVVREFFGLDSSN